MDVQYKRLKWLPPCFRFVQRTLPAFLNHTSATTIISQCFTTTIMRGQRSGTQCSTLRRRFSPHLLSRFRAAKHLHGQIFTARCTGFPFRCLAHGYRGGECGGRCRGGPRGSGGARRSRGRGYRCLQCWSPEKSIFEPAIIHTKRSPTYRETQKVGLLGVDSLTSVLGTINRCAMFLA